MLDSGDTASDQNHTASGRGSCRAGLVRRCDGLAREHPPLCLDPIPIRCRVSFPRFVPRLRLQEGNTHRTAPKLVIHDGVAGHARHAVEDKPDVALDMIAAGPDTDGVGETLVSVGRRSPPQIQLRADALHIGRKHRYIVALPLAVVENNGLFLGAPFDGNGAAPHGTRVFVSDGSWFGHEISNKKPRACEARGRVIDFRFRLPGCWP